MVVVINAPGVGGEVDSASMATGGGGGGTHWRRAVEGRVCHGGRGWEAPQCPESVTYVTTITTLYSWCKRGPASSQLVVMKVELWAGPCPVV